MTPDPVIPYRPDSQSIASRRDVGSTGEYACPPSATEASRRRAGTPSGCCCARTNRARRPPGPAFSACRQSPSATHCAAGTGAGPTACLTSAGVFVAFLPRVNAYWWARRWGRPRRTPTRAGSRCRWCCLTRPAGTRPGVRTCRPTWCRTSCRRAPQLQPVQASLPLLREALAKRTIAGSSTSFGWFAGACATWPPVLTKSSPASASVGSPGLSDCESTRSGRTPLSPRRTD